MADESVATGNRMTYSEFSRLPEQPGLQLIDGMLVREPSPGTSHQEVTVRLTVKLYLHVDARGLGKVFAAPLDVILEDEHVLQPDVMFISKERLHIIADFGALGAPDLIVEVLSPSTGRYDLGRKRQLCFQHGARELWIVDVDEATVTQHVRGECDWVATRLTRDDTLRSHVLPGFQSQLSEFFQVW